ncbi:MAG TPA: glycosyltransferase family 4 protein [Dehalococcoidia bacterium]|jgi:glycosyltransferase involved in cell wall biosynthesis|nr:glycosyltransferase family 4 protein [Dehalococcoidia bacterium]MDP7160138.1 glycosyltransferase family 4 protein [Dehalococcoidia bacterium]MDP7213351.1 glycosyltransferase family 4 protein [Dehalococcoidia bacterium]MDP7514054.1 glycosyltransferase family 4 protein [Dehalococcoidia bacterium]HJM53849.1 glycosyltransferase family 4 protein [Dehalococcoidia bacterium]
MLERVAVVSIAPILPGAVHGGSQRILDGVLRGLAEAGAHVRVVCSWRPENDGGFDLAPGVRVEPLLRLSGYFPDPWEVPPHQILQSAESVAPVFEWAESVYLHADTFYLRKLIPEGRRVVRSFHDFHYETALVSAFGFDADLTIVPSDYLKRCIDATVGAYRGASTEPVVVIPNGIDLEAYRSRPGVTPGGVRERRERDLVFLWPHRPDPRKGIADAVAIAARSARALPARNIRLLVPQHVDAASSAETCEFYDDAIRLATAEGVLGSLEFTPWWSGEETPDAYSFADVTLCPGNFIESFGLVAYESLACGTPIVAARVGALRDLPGHPDVHTFAYADADEATKATLIAAGGMTDPDGIRALLSEYFSFEKMQRAYVAAITGEMPEATRSASPTDDRFSLAPWCTVSGSDVYNDYGFAWTGRYELASFLHIVEMRQPGGQRFSLLAATEAGVPSEQIDMALRDGVIVRA